MKFKLIPVLLAPVLFVSCGSIQDTTSAAGQRVADLKHFSLADLRPSRVGVIEVRENELKEMPLGKDRAMAFEQKRQRNFWSFMTPANFKEPVLPEVGPADLDGSLLPPRS